MSMFIGRALGLSVGKSQRYVCFRICSIIFKRGFSRQARLQIKAARKDKTHLHLVLVVFCVYGKGISLLIDCRFEWAIVN